MPTQGIYELLSSLKCRHHAGPLLEMTKNFLPGKSDDMVEIWVTFDQ